MMKGEKPSGFQMELLCLSAEKYEPNVSALQEKYERWHETEIRYQSVYQALERLNEQGYLEKKAIDGRSNCYMLTNKGAELLASHRKLVLQHTATIEKALE